MLVTTTQTGRCYNPCDHSIDISNVLRQIEISVRVRWGCVSSEYYGEEHCPFL